MINSKQEVSCNLHYVTDTYEKKNYYCHTFNLLRLNCHVVNLCDIFCYKSNESVLKLYDKAMM